MTEYQDMSPHTDVDPPVTYEQWLIVKKLFKPRETQQQEEQAS